MTWARRVPFRFPSRLQLKAKISKGPGSALLSAVTPPSRQFPWVLAYPEPPAQAACRAILEQVFRRGAWLLGATGPEERCFLQSWRTTEVSGSARLLEDVTHPVVTRAVLTRVGSYQVVELVPGLGSREGVRTHSSPVSWVVRARRCCPRQPA